MQQPPKKHNPKEMAPRAYDYFKRAEKSGRVLTIAMICQYTGYAEGTLRGYIHKKYRHHFLHGDEYAGYTVNGLANISKAEFISWHRQTEKVPRVQVPPLVIEKEVEYCYRIEPGSVDMWLMVIGLVIAGLWWRQN